MDFDTVKLKNGDKLIINKISYEVLYVQGEALPAPDREPPYRLFLGVYLHDHQTKTIEPTHVLMYFYADTKEIFLKELQGRVIEPAEVELGR